MKHRHSVILGRMTRACFTEVYFGKHKSEVRAVFRYLGESTLGRGNSDCQGPKEGAWGFKGQQGVSEAGAD